MCVCKVKRERKNEKLYVCVSRYKVKREGKGEREGVGYTCIIIRGKRKKNNFEFLSDLFKLYIMSLLQPYFFPGTFKFIKVLSSIFWFQMEYDRVKRAG